MELEAGYRGSGDATLARHYQVIWLLAQGRTCPEVAGLTSVPRIRMSAARIRRREVRPGVALALVALGAWTDIVVGRPLDLAGDAVRRERGEHVGDELVSRTLLPGGGTGFKST